MVASIIIPEGSVPVVIYTDGACSRNPGPGGWGAYLVKGSREEPMSGGEAETTNNRMELMAAIQGLKRLTKPSRVTLHSDSQYLVKGMSEWLSGWKRNGWQNSAKKPVVNRDLWEELDRLASGHVVEWRWVKGHAGNIGNEKADKLANDGLSKAIKDAELAEFRSIFGDSTGA